MPRRFWVLTSCCCLLPDLDAVGFALGVPYDAFWGHRGFSHSLVFAALISLVVVSLAFVRIRRGSGRWGALWAYFFIITASNGLLDAMTNGGLGVAFFSPFDTTRYFFPWRPLAVSPVNPVYFFSDWGIEILRNEALWIWLPCLALVIATLKRRRA